MKSKSALQPPRTLFPEPPLRRKTSLAADAPQLFCCSANANKPGGTFRALPTSFAQRKQKQVFPHT